MGKLHMNFVNKIIEHLKQFVRRIRTSIIRNIMKINFKPYTKPTIVFESFGGRQVSDSPFAIYMELKGNPNINCVWSIKLKQKEYCEQHNIPYVVRRSVKWVMNMQRARVWVMNTRVPKWVRKPDYVQYIQTWHGTPLKKLGLDIKKVTMPNTTTDLYHQNFIYETHRWDALITANAYSTNIFKNAFDFHGQFLEVGYPRNDKLINTSSDEILKLKKKLGISENKKVVMYAPTYRDNEFAAKGQYLVKMPFSIEKLLNKLGKDTILILRMHYLIVGKMDLTKYNGKVMDFSQYSDISDLFLISDLLITDYSSVFFDYAYLKRPIVFFPYDYHEYKDELRGFYLNYERDLPGEIAWNKEQLVYLTATALINNTNQISEKMQKFYKTFCALHSGRSSVAVSNYILKLLHSDMKL